MRKTGTTNTHTRSLIEQLRSAALKQSAPVWKRIATDLEKSTRNRRVVNIYKLEKYAKDGETIVVPGKVLGVGDLKRKVKVAALTLSKQAEEKINNAGGQVIALSELIKENPKGKNVRILG